MNEIFPPDHAEEAYELMMSGELRFRSVLTTGKIAWLEVILFYF
jgi:D-arabinose 1-dehydrogenase-like Zn-dependent alcohol dehydrogenase